MVTTDKIIFLDSNGYPLVDQTKPYKDFNGDAVIDPTKPFFGKPIDSLAPYYLILGGKRIKELCKANAVPWLKDIL